MFYTGDWLKDPALRACSLSARGLWIDLLCLMHESDRRGYLQHATGKPVSLEQAARMTGGSTDEVSRLLQELEDSGVFSRLKDGTIYSRRMVADEHKRAACRDAGRRGGNPTLKGHPKGGSKGDPKGGSNPNPTPSYSSSVSVSVSDSPQSRSLSSGDLSAPPTPSTASASERFLADREHRTGDAPPGFQAFWSAYPTGHATDRGGLLALWRRSSLEDDSRAVLDGLAAWKGSERWREGYVVKARKFLEERHWEVPPPAPKAKPQALGGAW